jgi:phosphoglycerol transferase MdoB-like AlkP superfamily enzyme
VISSLFQAVPHQKQTVRSREPILAALALALLVRTFGVIRHYLGMDILGHPVAIEPVRFIPWAVPYHMGVMVAVAAVMLLLVRMVPRARSGTGIRRAAFILFGILIATGQVDLELMRYLGQHLTLALLRQYVGPAALTDAGDYLLEDSMHLVVSFLLITLGWVGLALVWRSHQRAEPAAAPSWKILLSTALLAVTFITWPHLYSHSGNRLRVVTPSEVLAVAHAFARDRVKAPEDERAAITKLRAHLPLADAWRGDELPLVHTPKHYPADARTGDRLPDIFIIVIESLRGRSVGYGPSAPVPSPTPVLDTLARRGVVFSQFISNGWPSAQGFLAIHCSAWPLMQSYMLSDHASVDFDCLPPRLADHGYQTVFFSASNPAMDNQLPWARRMYEDIEVKRGKTHDRLMIDDLLSWLEARDSRDNRPLFAYIATASLHTPFAVADPAIKTPVPDDLGERYVRAVGYTDTQVGRIIAALEARKRASDTVIFIMGDHASPLPIDKSAPDVDKYTPCDHMVWTSALVVGPERLVGPPRRDDTPASQVDIMPSVLAMIGDRRPTAALGQDLFTPVPGGVQQPRAISVLQDAIRLDTMRHSLFISADRSRVWAQDRRANADCVPGAPPTAELEAQAHRARDLVDYWSYLVESNRIWRPALRGDASRP